jgi:methyl-accepting chemotaxis protein
MDDEKNSKVNFESYVNRITHDWSKLLTFFAVLLIPLFIILDYFTVSRELFGQFTAYRLIATLLLLIQHFVVRFSKPGRFSFIHGYISSIIASVMIMLMILQLGGFNSGYYAGLNLVIIAVNLFLPWRYIHALFNSVFVILLYITVNGLFGEAFILNNLINNLFFLSSTVFFTVSISYLRFTLTRKEFGLREDLQNAQVNEINALAEIAQTVASGDLTINIESKSREAVGILEISFEKMIVDLRNALSQVKEISDYIASFSYNIKGSTDQMRNGAQEQLAQTTQSANLIKLMNNIIIDSSQKVRQTDEMADQAIVSASRSSEFVDKAVKGMNTVAGVVRQSADKVQSLGKSSEKINEIVLVINDIADQTNLLALNASIEAARAGDQGKGFAIVADEVGKLSDRTTSATKEISDMIQTVLRDISIAVTTMDTANSEVDTSIQFVQDMHQSMKEIIDLSRNLRDMIGDIANLSKEETNAAEQMNNDITMVSTIAQQMADSIDTIAGTVDEMNDLTGTLEKMVNKFRLQ